MSDEDESGPWDATLGAAPDGDERADALQRPARAAPVATKRPWWKRPWAFLLPAGVGFAVAGAAILLVLRPGVPGGDLPPPSVALLRAQARAAEGAGSDALDAAMASYRDGLHARLGERYAP